MENMLIIYAMLFIAYHEAYYVYAMNRVGLAHTKNIRLPICVIILMCYTTPRIIAEYQYTGNFLLVGALWISQAVLIAVVAFIGALRYDRFLKARKHRGDQ